MNEPEPLRSYCQRRTVHGQRITRYACGCGYETAWQYEAREQLAAADLRGHFAAEHSTAAGFGICAECGTLTDDFRAHVPDLGTDVWLCRQHAPALPVVLDQAGAGEDQAEPAVTRA